MSGRLGSPRTTRIHEILEERVRQRQSLRLHEREDRDGLLEANRLSIVYWQAELGRALLDERSRDEAVA